MDKDPRPHGAVKSRGKCHKTWRGGGGKKAPNGQETGQAHTEDNFAKHGR